MKYTRANSLHIPDHLHAKHSEEKTPAYVMNTRPRSWWRTLFRLAIVVGLTCSVLGGCGGLYIFAKFATGIPSLDSLSQYRPPLPTTFYSDEGDVVGEFSDQRRVLVPFNKIPKRLVHAFVAAEDDRFFQHGGVDPVGIMRAITKNLKTGRLSAGGSTLTQQAAKSFLLERMKVYMKAGICRNDKQCAWDQRCKTRPGSAFGRCTKRSFRSCLKRVPVIVHGRPASVFRGYSTLCDPFEICKPGCSKGRAKAGTCRKWTCWPMAPKATCSSDASCGFGRTCAQGACAPNFRKQVADLIDLLGRKGVEVRRVTGPAKLLSSLKGDFRRQTSRTVMISATRAGRIDLQKIERLVGVKAVYRFAEKSFRRKVREAILAAQLERKFSKNQILWLYLNQVFLGHRAYGVQAAAQNYFGKNVWELTLAESAVLAALPKAPSTYDPYRYPKRVKKRIAYVLKRMKELGYITEKERTAALKEKIVAKAIPDLFRSKAPYFADEVRRYVLKKYGKEQLLKGGLQVHLAIDVVKQGIARKHLRRELKNLDQRQGFRGPLGVIPRKFWERALAKAAKYYGDRPPKRKQIYGALVTAIDHGRQVATVRIGKHKAYLPLSQMRWARKPNAYKKPSKHMIARISWALKVGYWILVEPIRGSKRLRPKIEAMYGAGITIVRLRQDPKVEGALISINPHSGYLHSLVGGYSFKKSPYNRAIYACRQPGSAFKPILFTAALEIAARRKGRGRRERLTPATVLQDTPLVHDNTRNRSANRYKPSNYGGFFSGDMIMYKALIKSKNVPAIRLLMKVGMQRTIRYARKMGITTDISEELGMALGQSCMKPWELAMFYATLARGGLKPKPILVKAVLDREGKVLEDNRVYYDPTLSPEGMLNRMEHHLYRKETRLISPANAFIMTHMLRGVVKKGGSAPKVGPWFGRPVAGKTGTTNDSFDVWFAGYTRKHATLLWMGFDKNEKPLGAWETGGYTAAPAWVRYMRELVKGESLGGWPRPWKYRMAQN